MFKKFTTSESIISQGLAKSSVQRGIRANALEHFPALEEHIDEFMPKKSNCYMIKCQDQIQLVAMDNEIKLFNAWNGPYMPPLRIVHKYPNMLPAVQVDRGAIKFVLGGANVMCPGLTSAGGRLPDGLKKGDVVVIMAEGKQHALAIGTMLMSSEEIRKVNKGHGIENVHYLNDGLWNAHVEAT